MVTLWAEVFGSSIISYQIVHWAVNMLVIGIILALILALTINPNPKPKPNPNHNCNHVILHLMELLDRIR